MASWLPVPACLFSVRPPELADFHSILAFASAILTGGSEVSTVGGAVVGGRWLVDGGVRVDRNAPLRKGIEAEKDEEQEQDHEHEQEQE
jgi:hypothetical protein